MFKRIFTLFMARNREYFRDKSALSWNFAFPFLIIAGFGVIFTGNSREVYKIAIVGNDAASPALSSVYENFRAMKTLQFVENEEFSVASSKLGHHRIDMILEPSSGKYWISRTSPKGYIAEKMLEAASIGSSGSPDTRYVKNEIEGHEIPYQEWLFPGILGMNMMFSALFGVGYVVVRYRKNGVLKRLSVTPLKPWEFLTAQMLSRMFLILFSTAIVYSGCSLLYGFKCKGSFADLLLTGALGGFSMISIGLVIASRTSSEELAEGLLNFITWPMMFLSGVWFSLEGSKPWVIEAAKIMPLSHLISAARKIMNDGANLYDIKFELASLGLMSLVYLAAGSLLFKWGKD